MKYNKVKVYLEEDLERKRRKCHKDLRIAVNYPYRGCDLPGGSIQYLDKKEEFMTVPDGFTDCLADEKDENFSCVICLENKKCCLMVPCNHLCLCVSCSKSLKTNKLECPVCREPVKKIQVVYS